MVMDHPKMRPSYGIALDATHFHKMHKFNNQGRPGDCFSKE
jgi:hypothetical protein